MRKLIYLLFPLMMLAGSSAFAKNFAISYDLQGDNRVAYQSDYIEDPVVVGADDYNGDFYILGDGAGTTHDGTVEKFDQNSGTAYAPVYLEDEIKAFAVGSDGYKVILNNENQLKFYDTNFSLKSTHQFQDKVIGMVIDKENNMVYILTDEHELKKMKLNSDGTIECETSVTVPDTAKGLYYQEYYKELIVVTADNLDFYHPDTLKDGSFKHIPIDDPTYIRFTNSYIITIRAYATSSHVKYYDYSGYVLEDKCYDVNNRITGVLVKENGDLILKTADRNDNCHMLEYRSCNDGWLQWYHEFEYNINSMCLSPDQDKIFVLTDEGGDADSELMCFDCYGDKKWTKRFADEMDVVICGKNRVFAVDGSNLNTGETVDMIIGLAIAWTIFCALIFT